MDDISVTLDCGCVAVYKRKKNYSGGEFHFCEDHAIASVVTHAMIYATAKDFRDAILADEKPDVVAFSKGLQS